MQEIDQKPNSIFSRYKIKVLCTVTSSKRIARSEYLDEGIPFYRSKEIILKSKGLSVDSEIHISKDRFNEIKDKFSVPSKGDLLISAVGSIGFSYVVGNEEFYFKDGNLLWLKDFKEGLNSDFIKLLLDSDEIQRKIADISAGSSQSALTIVKLNELELPIPDPIEQQEISDVITTVNKKIDLIGQKITQTNLFKKGLMQKLFSEGVGVQGEDGNWQPHTEFKNGVPVSWTTQSLGLLAKVTSGGTPSRRQTAYWENGHIPWVTTGEVDFNTIKKTEQMITHKGLEKSAAKLFPKNTVLMAMYGQGKTRGRVALLGIEATTNQACGAIICGENLVPEYCYQYLAFNYENIRNIGNEGSQKNLNGKLIKEFLIPCPNMNEQSEIAKIASLVDIKLQLLELQKAETQQLKKGLMQKLLTG